MIPEYDELEDIPLHITGFQIQRLKGIMYIVNEDERLQAFNILFSELLVESIDLFGKETTIEGL
jgi:hypothetical protein